MQLHCEHNFGKYCPISIILSVLRTEINYDQLDPGVVEFRRRVTSHAAVDFFLRRFADWPSNFISRFSTRSINKADCFMLTLT